MKKFLIAFAFAATLLSGGAIAQPGPGPTPNPWVVSGNQISYAGCVLIPLGVSGGCKGSGTLNATAIYQAGFPVLGTLANGKIFVGNASAIGIAQTPSGDLTITNTGVFTVSSNVITNSKLATAAAVTLKGNPTNATADVQDFTLSGLTALASPSTTLDLLLIWDHTAGTLKSVTPSALTTAVGGITALTGDVAATGPGSVAATIQANVVSYSKFQQVAASSLVGNPTGSLANAQGITLGATLAFSGTALQTAAHTGDATSSANSFALTLATVNSNVGTFGSATQASQITVNGKGLVTAASSITVTPAVGSITGLGTGVATALGVNVGSAGAFVTFNGAGGTPSSMVGTNITGTAASLTAGNVTTNANLTGPITSVGNATSIASQTGTGTTFVMSAAPSIVGGTHTAITSLGLRNAGTGAFDLTLATNGGTLTAGRTLSFGMTDANRVIGLSGDLQIAGNFTTAAVFTQAGAFATTITSTGITNSTLPAGTHTLAGLDVAQTWAAAQSFGSGFMKLNGSSSGALTVNCAAACGTNTLTLPGGTTDFSATGGTSQVVKQTSAGGAFTVAQLAFSDISGTIAAGQVSGSYTGITGVGTLAAGTISTGVTINYSNITPSGTIAGANVATVANASGSPSATFGVMKADGTTIQCTSGICSSVGGVATSIQVGVTTVTSGTNNFLLYNNSSVLGNASVGTGISLSGGALGLSLTNATLQGTPSIGAGTTSGTPKMMGYGATCHLTPVYSGRVLVIFGGAMSNTSAGGQVQAQMYFGTGSAPANGASATGTAFGPNPNTYIAVGTAQAAFSEPGIVTGLSVGVAAWFDVGVSALGTAGTASLGGITCTAMEF